MSPVFADMDLWAIALSGLIGGGAVLALGGVYSLFQEPKPGQPSPKIPRQVTALAKTVVGAVLALGGVATRSVMNGTAPPWLNDLVQSFRA
jgi:hypothetical protein